MHNLLFFFIYFGTIKVMFKKFIKLGVLYVIKFCEPIILIKAKLNRIYIPIEIKKLIRITLDGVFLSPFIKWLILQVVSIPQKQNNANGIVSFNNGIFCQFITKLGL